MSVASALLLALPVVVLLLWAFMGGVNAHELLEARVTALEIKMAKLMGGGPDGA